ncbi:hypothetical protein [Streptomyces sp. NPDC047525]|uniref:hypothetical protein n=1 Tax=Streptomyces sp. NPDC047525 TaxID=3155264 RepID=UPI0033F9B903
MRRRKGLPSGPTLVRVAVAPTDLKLFALSGIATVLVTRAFLALAGYPKLGGGGAGGLHIAHMLWGGLLMMAAIVLMLTFIGRTPRIAAALVGGVGFGLFIDEVGKQITDEPGYFYQPAAGIIYLSFALLLVLTHLIRRHTANTARAETQAGSHAHAVPQAMTQLTARAAAQRTVNAADLALAGVTAGLTAEQRQTATRLVAGSGSEVDAALVRLLAALPERPPAEPARWRSWATGVGRVLRRVARSRLVLGLAVFCLLTEAVLFAVWMTMDVVGGELVNGPHPGAHLAVALTEVTSAVLGVVGLTRLGSDRMSAFRFFQAALLVDILFGQIFKFTLSQFAAVIELGIDLGLFWVVSVFVSGQDRAVFSSGQGRVPEPAGRAGNGGQPAALSEPEPESGRPAVSEAR